MSIRKYGSIVSNEKYNKRGKNYAYAINNIKYNNALIYSYSRY